MTPAPVPLENGSTDVATPRTMDYPGSVEEAAALLGATITRCCSAMKSEAILPPQGMHPAFAVVSHESGGLESELLHRLYVLRSMLRTVADSNEQLPSAPSILQVLKKLLGISTQMAASVTSAGTATVIAANPSVGVGSTSLPQESAASSNSSANEPSEQQPRAQRRVIPLLHRSATPPLWSTPCCSLWVDCVVLCHALSTGNGGDLTLFVRQMLALASIHPRSAKAGGGVRIAALAVLTGLLEHEDVVSPVRKAEHPARNFALATKLAPWSLDILQVCLKALRSAGNGEPTFREAAIRAACATATACRNAALKSRQNRGETSAGETDALVLLGAMEDKAIAESLKILKQAVTDKFPEIRSAAATFVITLAPILIPHVGTSVAGDPLASLEEVLQLALRNIDDEIPFVAEGWAEAVARCLCTAIYYSDLVKISAQANVRAVGDASSSDGGNPVESAASSVSPTNATASRFGSRKQTGLVHQMSSIKMALNYLVERFVKAGGEFGASKAGGAYSIGGRSVRLGLSRALSRLLRIQSSLLAIGESRSISIQAVISAVLEMVKVESDDQLKTGAQRSSSIADVTLVRLFANRVLRQGLCEIATEASQLIILQEMIGLLPSAPNAELPSSTTLLNASQQQVIMIEISNIVETLGEAAGSRIEELRTKLEGCLASSNHGTRYEAALACVAIATKFPAQGIHQIVDSLETIEQELAKLMANISATPDKNNSIKQQSSTLFRRNPNDSGGQIVTTASIECSIHGRALLVSMLVKTLPNQFGVLSRETLASVLRIAEILVSSQFNEVITSANAGAVCACVRAGFVMISGVLTTGPDALEAHLGQILSAWKNAGKAAIEGGKSMSPLHDLACVESTLTSITVFLKYCSELLLIVPEALSQVSMLLEGMFKLLQSNGRLGSISKDPVATLMLESATASLLEAFAWLPSGSFPLVADEVFSFSASQIRKSVEANIACSILDSLVTREDAILDSRSFSRADRDGQLGGARDIDESFVLLTGEVALYSERESVLHLQSDVQFQAKERYQDDFCGSLILEQFVSDSDIEKPPTPLHEVGTWRRPFDPSCSSKVRIIDSAIQAFSATFGLKDGKEQQGAMNMLESLVPFSLSQFAKALGISSVAVEQEKRSKVKEDGASALNITAVLLSCLKALPLHEATHNIPIGLGPPWMNKAKDLLLSLLPSSSSNVRRAAAEGLALLATLGVTEDAHFLQSSLLHSLDEVMQSNKHEGKARSITLDQVSAARAGSLLTLACIQRTAHNMAKRKNARARARFQGSKSSESLDKASDDLPVLQMMTRILPSAACHGFKEYILVKTYALYAFTVLLMYSKRLVVGAASLSEEEKQLLRKGVELVDDNYIASWTAASSDFDRGQDSERLACEVTFVAALLRLMTFLIPFIHHVREEDYTTAGRFVVMATIILERFGFHPVVFVEAMAFFEVAGSHQYRYLLPSISHHVSYTENAVVACLPSIVSVLAPGHPEAFGRDVLCSGHAVNSVKSFQAACLLIKRLPLDDSGTWNPMVIGSLVVAALETVCGSQVKSDFTLFRTISAGRSMKYLCVNNEDLERDMVRSLFEILLVNDEGEYANEQFLRCILFARQLLSRLSTGVAIDAGAGYSIHKVVDSALAQSEKDISFVFSTTNSVRWQVKCLSAQLAASSLQQLRLSELQVVDDIRKSSHFDLVKATVVCSTTGKKIDAQPTSRVVLHLEDILASACMSAVATVDQAELRCLQENAMSFLLCLIECFSLIPDPEDPTKSILYQYSTQIFSSVKHALASPGDKNATPLLSSVYVTGCKVLHLLVKTRLTSDVVTLKRLLRMVTTYVDSLHLFSFTDGFQSLESMNGPYLLVRVCSIWTIGNILLDRRMNLKAEFVDEISRDLIPDKVIIAVNLAAAAFDGCHLLNTSSASLTGRSIQRDDSKGFVESGFFFENAGDMDDQTKSFLVRTWSQCSTASIETLLEVYCSLDSGDERQTSFATWIGALVPLFLSGIVDGINTIVNDKENETCTVWIQGIDPILVLNDCLFGAGRILDSGRRELFELFADDITAVIQCIWESIVREVLDPKAPSSLFNGSIVSEACNLIKIYIASEADTKRENFFILPLMLQPLSLLSNGILHMDDSRVESVVVTCLLGIGSLIRCGSATNMLVNAMLHLCMTELTSENKRYAEGVRDPLKTLMKDCLDHNSSNTDYWNKVLCQLASSGRWEEWATFASFKDGGPIRQSMAILQHKLRDPKQFKSHAAAFSGIRVVLPNAATAFSSLLLHSIGADVVALFYQYGTMKIAESGQNRTLICADAMKIVLLAYRQLTTNEEDSEELVTTFITIVFETFLAVIRFNGLPNHPSPEPSGDPALGRICAQAILYVARTTPGPFKHCVAVLTTDLERNLLEFAVRAEMNGYVVNAPATEPTKKKLTLKGFKK